MECEGIETLLEEIGAREASLPRDCHIEEGLRKNVSVSDDINFAGHVIDEETMDPSPAWNRKLILARGGESLLAGTWTTSSSTTANFIGADLLPPSPQACSIAAVQANPRRGASTSSDSMASRQRRLRLAVQAFRRTLTDAANKHCSLGAVVKPGKGNPIGGRAGNGRR
jgi:hypothetical protein